jgi:hypothetical protein
MLPVERIDITTSTKRNFLTRRKGTRAGGKNEVFSMLDTLATADAYREENVDSVDEQDD